jgi:hypothetical protein
MKIKCDFCEYVFKSEQDGKDHSCKYSERFQKVRTLTGLLAFDLYKSWRQKKGFFTGDESTFIMSKYFTVFFNLGEFMNKKSIPLRQHYLDFCIKATLLPNNWYSETVYMEYLMTFDNEVDPELQYKISKKTINSLADMIDCQPNQVLHYLNFDEIAKLVYTKNLSPWFLLFSKVFNHIYKNKLTNEERILCDRLINRDVWVEKLRANRETSQTIINLIKEDSF